MVAISVKRTTASISRYDIFPKVVKCPPQLAASVHTFACRAPINVDGNPVVSEDSSFDVDVPRVMDEDAITSVPVTLRVEKDGWILIRLKANAWIGLDTMFDTAMCDVIFKTSQLKS